MVLVPSRITLRPGPDDRHAPRRRPIVRATGGSDTVRDHAAGNGNGFVFEEPSVESLAAAIRRAIDLHREPRAWRTLQHRAARKDFSWEESAKAYAAVYRRTMRASRARGV
jgi:starch synthase